MGQPGEDFAPTDHLSPEERDLEVSPADAFEQATVVAPVQVESYVHRGMEVDDFDAVEQSRVVEFDEDDYR